jgi:hypothetical protein
LHAYACRFALGQKLRRCQHFHAAKKLYTEHQYWRVERLAETQNARISDNRFAKPEPPRCCSAARRGVAR